MLQTRVRSQGAIKWWYGTGTVDQYGCSDTGTIRHKYDSLLYDTIRVGYGHRELVRYSYSTGVRYKYVTGFRYTYPRGHDTGTGTGAARHGVFPSASFLFCPSLIRCFLVLLVLRLFCSVTQPHDALSAETNPTAKAAYAPRHLGIRCRFCSRTR